MRLVEPFRNSQPRDALLAGGALRARRHELGLTQAALAQILGVTATSVARWERGEQRIGNPAVVRLALEQLEGRASLQRADSLTRQPTHNLPGELSSFVGRGDEIAQLTQLLANARLLTLAGAGGIGKTRLAARLAGAALADADYKDGVWLVELAPLSDPALVDQAVADILAPPERHSAPPRQRLVTALRNKHLLLVLDNCEHLVSACADLVAALVRACAGVRVLATSREPLGLTGEVTWRVPPLSVPDRRMPFQVEVLVRSDAAQLFIERVTALQPNFCVTERNAPAIAEACRRLDGIPLALELAAAHVPALGADGVVRHLDDRFRLLVGGDRTAPSRHQTLQATIDWSYALLDQTERALLDRLSVFAGGTTFDALGVVCGSGSVAEGPGVEPNAMLRLLEKLIAKSLVIAEPDASGSARYHLLETLRAYASDRLRERGDTPNVQRKHAGFFTQLAERAEPELTGIDQASWLERLEQEHDNLRLALVWTLENDVELGLRLAGALARFWYVRGHLSEGTAWLDRMLVSSTDATPWAARANALTAAGILAWHRADTGQAETRLRASLALRGDAPDDARFSRTLYELAKVLSQRGDHTSARAFGEQALTRWRRDGDTWGTAVALNFLGELLREEGNLAVASRRYEESRQLFEVAGDQRGLAIATQNLGIVAIEQGDFQRARELHRATLPLKRELGDREGLAASLVNLAYLALLGGNEGRAARLCGAAQLAHESVGAVLPPYERRLAARTVERARGALGRTAFSTHWVEGRRMGLDQAVAEALEPDVVADDSTQRTARLTRRQREVTELVAQGLTNRELADRLVIAEGTAERHVADILGKLGLSSRVHLAAWAIDHGLRPDA